MAAKALFATDVAALRAVVDANVRASNEENLTAYMATIDPDSAVYAPTRASTAEAFDTYDLRASIESFEVRSTDATQAVAHIVQRTVRSDNAAKSPADAEFRNNRVTADWQFRRTDAGWKITGQLVLGVEYLDGAPTTTAAAA